MLKIFLYAIIGIAAVGGLISAFHLYSVSMRNKQEMAAYNEESYTLSGNPGKVLVVYYSMSGHTKDIAQRIQRLTNADVYEIQTKQPMKSGAMLHLEVKQQIKSGQYPELVGNKPDFSSYDTIFVGSPVWWYTVSTPVLSFLKQTDFQGKKVIPFSTQGSNFGSFFEDFRKNTQGGEVLEGEAFNNMGPEYDETVNNKIISWINKLK